jgi:hypothetical protein
MSVVLHAFRLRRPSLPHWAGQGKLCEMMHLGCSYRSRKPCMNASSVCVSLESDASKCRHLLSRNRATLCRQDWYSVVSSDWHCAPSVVLHSIRTRRSTVRRSAIVDKGISIWMPIHMLCFIQQVTCQKLPEFLRKSERVVWRMGCFVLNIRLAALQKVFE